MSSLRHFWSSVSCSGTFRTHAHVCQEEFGLVWKRARRRGPGASDPEPSCKRAGQALCFLVVTVASDISPRLACNMAEGIA